MRTTFSREQMIELAKNPCVFRVEQKSIHYTFEFKERALDLHSQGVRPNEIWRRSGFDVNIWKKNYTNSTVKDWEQLVDRGGLQSLTKKGGMQSDSGLDRRSTEAERLKRLELQVRYLKAENDFLAKLRAKRAESNSGRVRNTESSEH